MITLDRQRCTKCGKCVRLMKGYCIVEEGGFPVFDLQLCNLCQKCVAVCPSQAIQVNGVYPEKIKERMPISPKNILILLEKRRSIKHFKDKSIPKEIIRQIISVAKYSPNQNKNISILVLDDKGLISDIDNHALSFVRYFYNLLFGLKPVTAFIKIFSKNIDIIKRKMEFDLFERKHVVKENTQVLIVLTGNKRVPVTEKSAHYLLSNMIIMAESLEIGNSLMDSLVLTLNTNHRLRKRLNIRENVLGVMALGYSNENIVNIPRGYEIPVRWNG